MNYIKPMVIKKTENRNLSVELTREELLLLRDMIGNTYSGGDDWRVNPEDFEKKFGLSYERAVQIASIMKELQQQKDQRLSITLPQTEWSAIKTMTARLVELWDEGDFSTMISTDKVKASALLKEFGYGGL
jgi:hypothetical protein